jgi:DNA helicase-2/ATP-dependent DNA helicase PcrA
MVEKKLIFSNYSIEAQQVIELIKQGKNFLLSGGAGSGKTYTLVETLKALIEIQPLSNIACITYTNAAADEIEERVEHPNLYVSTIHEFLWRNIKHFQEELKKTLIELIIDETQPKFRILGGEEVDHDFYNNLREGIQYKEFVRLKDGIISHDELIVLAHKMYEKYPKLCAITKDTYPFIFVDEYQDTSKLVVEILLEHLKQSQKENIIGFFGDAMQSIYDGSIGNIDEYKGQEAHLVNEVKKEQNRRNPKLVIDLSNKIRTDGLSQHPSDDPSAPNMDSNGNVKEGSVLFLYSDDDDLNNVREYLGWAFSDAKQNKELNLTHNLIAAKAGFGELMRIYDSDKILDFVVRLKKYIKDHPGSIETEGKTLKNVIDELQVGKSGRALKAVSPTKGMQEYIDTYQATYEEALECSFDQIASIYLNKDQLIDDKKNNTEENDKPGSNRDDLIKHLFKIQHALRLYEEKKYNEFIRITDFKITSLQAKSRLQKNVKQLVEASKKTISEVINKADDCGIVLIDDRVQKFKENKKYIYDQVCKLNFEQFQKLYQYLEGFTPFSTQHKTKGAEFPNVLVVLDNGNWNNYNFNYLFTNKGTESVLRRTQKIFYVCCTRAKEQLAVFFHQPSQAVIDRAEEWFGKENVQCID